MSPTTNNIENNIIEEILKGNAAAFKQLVDKYQNYVFTIAFRMTNNREDAEEIAQDSFVKCFKSLSDFKGDSKFSTWLYMITHNTTLTFLRKKKIPVVSTDREEVTTAIENISDNANYDTSEHRSKKKMLAEAITKLPKDDAEVITLFYQGEQSLEEIAKLLKIETNAVKVRLFRARTKLKTILEKYYQQELSENL